MTIQRLLTLVVTSVFLAACGGHHYDDDHHHHHDDHHYVDDRPSLYQFEIIDTYGTNSEFDKTTELALSPYVNSGHFEVFWNMDSDYDYFVELRFNNYPTTDGSRLITSELCGPGYYCHDHQYQFCDYRTNLVLECESSSGDYQSEYIGDMLVTIPEDAYLILQVCDTSFFYCEYEARHVSVE